jgi:hypothetical protein
LTKATTQHGIHAKHLLRLCGAEGMPNWLGALVKSILHSKQDNFILLLIRVGLMWYPLGNLPIVMTSSVIMQLCRGRLNFPQLSPHLQQKPS